MRQKSSLSIALSTSEASSALNQLLENAKEMLTEERQVQACVCICVCMCMCGVCVYVCVCVCGVCVCVQKCILIQIQTTKIAFAIGLSLGISLLTPRDFDG